MGPEVIAVDEIGSAEDVHAIEYAMHCGCKMLATVHAGSMEELRKKPLLDQMIDQGRFERYILLGNRAHVGRSMASSITGAASVQGRCQMTAMVKTFGAVLIIGATSLWGIRAQTVSTTSMSRCSISRS